jgi:hypothetical protein
MKFCKDCDHFRDRDMKCLQEVSFNLVTGTEEFFFAETQRSYGPCGKDGVLFVQRKPQFTDDELDDLSSIPFGVNLQGAIK